jgi:hypothetical protein
MHVGDSVDSNLVSQHAVREDEWKAANHATADAQVGSNTGEQRTDRGEPDDQLHGALDRSSEAETTTTALLLVLISGGIKLGASGRCELDGSHERFWSRARASENTVSAGTPGSLSSTRRSISLAHAAATAF